MLCAPDRQFAGRLHDLMEQNDCTTAELARLTGISHFQILGYLAGKTPDTMSLLRIARLFEVSMEWLVTGEDGAHTPDYLLTASA